MLSSNMKKKAFELQQHTATKKLFKAVNEGKSILVYGPPGSGKAELMGRNEVLLNKHTFTYVNLQQNLQVKQLLQRKDLFVANGHYTGNRRLHLPRDDIEEIFLPMSLGHSNELQYESGV